MSHERNPRSGLPPIETDYTEAEIKELRDIGSWLVLMLHVALERPSNAEWLAEYHRKQDKKWKQYCPKR